MFWQQNLELDVRITEYLSTSHGNQMNPIILLGLEIYDYRTITVILRKLSSTIFPFYSKEFIIQNKDSEM